MIQKIKCWLTKFLDGNKEESCAHEFITQEQLSYPRPEAIRPEDMRVVNLETNEVVGDIDYAEQFLNRINTIYRINERRSKFKFCKFCGKERSNENLK